MSKKKNNFRKGGNLQRTNQQRGKTKKDLKETSIFDKCAEGIFLLLAFFFNLISYYKSGFNKKTSMNVFKVLLKKGPYGEFSLYRKIRKTFGKENIFVNLYVPNQNTDYTEVDLVAVSKNQIFVFEVKNFSGLIYGSQQDKMWTQFLNKNSKFPFYNPLRQNYAHTEALKKTLNLKQDVFQPLVVFSNRSKLQKITVNENNEIFTFKTIKRKLKKEIKNSTLEPFEDRVKILIALNRLTKVSEEIKEKHIEQVKEISLKKAT